MKLKEIGLEVRRQKEEQTEARRVKEIRKEEKYNIISLF